MQLSGRERENSQRLHPVQRVQNAAACLVLELSTSDHVTELHWLPVPWRVKCRLCCIMHSVFLGRCSAYLTATVQSQSLNASRPHLGQRLRSTSSTDFSLPQLRTKFGERAFSHAGLAAWNSMPEHIRAEPDIRVFRKLLKTDLFNLAFNAHWHSGFIVCDSWNAPMFSM